MAKTATPAIGIDLATTQSVIARIDDTGCPVTVPNREGGLATASAVLFDSRDVVVGDQALAAMGAEANRVASCAKRDMGKRVYGREVDGRYFSPEVIQAYIIRKLKNDAERQIGSFHQAVITVPAYFDESRRKGTQDAGYMAGLEVIDIVNEPTAAALAYGFQRGSGNDRAAGQQPEHVLVYDLGGGTFDVTVLRIDGDQFTALATDGDVQLGGNDWDYQLLDFAAEEFVSQHNVDPRDNLDSSMRLWRDCEAAKRTLTARSSASIVCAHEGKAIRLEVTREQFEKLTVGLLDQTLFTTRQTLREANLTWDQIDQLLLVGGSTRMPCIRNSLQEVSGLEPSTAVSPDEAVAHGAALHAASLLAQHQGQPAPFRLTNVNAHSLGVVGLERGSGLKRNATLIPRNTSLPASAKRSFRTKHNSQRTVKVTVVEGECPSPDGCIEIGRCVVQDLPAGLPAGTPIEVHFQYAANGRLQIQVGVANSGAKLRHEIIRQNRLTQEELDQWRGVICADGQA